MKKHGKAAYLSTLNIVVGGIVNVIICMVLMRYGFGHEEFTFTEGVINTIVFTVWAWIRVYLLALFVYRKK